MITERKQKVLFLRAWAAGQLSAGRHPDDVRYGMHRLFERSLDVLRHDCRQGWQIMSQRSGITFAVVYRCTPAEAVEAWAKGLDRPVPPILECNDGFRVWI